MRRFVCARRFDGYAGIALGGAVGQNMAGMMNGMMTGMTQPANSPMTPPPVPVAAYHVAVNGAAAGPFDIATLSQMATVGTFTRDSLVWKTGMENWAKANTIDELASVFTAIPPVPPTEC